MIERRALLAAPALLAVGCASAPTERGALDPQARSALIGRIALNVQAHGSEPASSFTAEFDLRGDAERGSLALTGPLGATIAQARWQPGAATLRSSDGEHSYPTLDALAQALLGQPLPLAALIDWLRGQPWAGAPSASAGNGFEQLGWRVDLTRFAEGLVAAARDAAPALTVRVRLEREP